MSDTKGLRLKPPSPLPQGPVTKVAFKVFTNHLSNLQTLQDEAHIEAMLSEEEVARLSGEVAWLKEETRYGDRKVGELEEQVINCARLLMTSANFPFILLVI